MEAAGGFEPPNTSFANSRLRPLGHAAPLEIEKRTINSLSLSPRGAEAIAISLSPVNILIASMYKLVPLVVKIDPHPLKYRPFCRYSALPKETRLIFHLLD